MIYSWKIQTCYHILTEGNTLNLIDSLFWASHVTSMSLTYIISKVKVTLLVQNQTNEWGDILRSILSLISTNIDVLNTNICFLIASYRAIKRYTI